MWHDYIYIYIYIYICIYICIYIYTHTQCCLLKVQPFMEPSVAEGDTDSSLERVFVTQRVCQQCGQW